MRLLILLIGTGLASTTMMAPAGSESVSGERGGPTGWPTERGLPATPGSDSARRTTFSMGLVSLTQPDDAVPSARVTYGALPTVGLLSLAEDATDQQSPAPAAKSSIWRELFACDVPVDRLWSFEFAVGMISDNTPSDYMEPTLIQLNGPGGGVTYNFTVTRRIHQFSWDMCSVTWRPELEIPARLTLVDENSGRVIPDLNIGLVLRWRDFIWNKFLRTTLAAGGGLSYSFQPWTADYQRHPEDSERSRLKFWLPIEVTLALPRFPRHQLVTFIDHQSGGTLFDKGGVDAWGFGYRLEF